MAMPMAGRVWATPSLDHVGSAPNAGRGRSSLSSPKADSGLRLLETALEGGRPPLQITGGPLSGLTHTPEVPSAQIKSAVLLAGLRAAGTTTVVEEQPTRDHTERALAAFGVDVDRSVPGRLTVHGGTALHGGLALRVPGDPSASAFLGVAAAGLPGSTLVLHDVGLNPTRTALFEVLRRAGASVTVTTAETWHGEPVGTVEIATGTLGDVVISPAEVPLLIDELPALAALATFGGSCTVRGAAELRVKESDRISALVGGLRAMGADADEFDDGFAIRGGRRLTGGAVDAHHDHRLAMAFAVAALGASGPTLIHGAEVAAVSFPRFFETLDGLRV